ncbi:unnamed protein product [Acanthoscelides obtectus]|uniref:Uncharacterized protein n=1 Tax=Acanthoscelides obtectus TaxID=200917 RepID=A0A9P0KC14_ACAOB|nr:unnamed protein product [Acanthoscelides obtectus]CAK1626792.1 hypothetical protein AOBTE_LOCUS4079 [Acanthoscelides obtectus]
MLSIFIFCLVSLASSVETLRKSEVITPHATKYNSEGFVIFNEKGEVGKLCTENINRSLPANQTIGVLHSVASSLCKTLTYQNVISVNVETDIENNISYVKMKNPTAPEISFVRSKCPSKQVLKVACSELECDGDSRRLALALGAFQGGGSHLRWNSRGARLGGDDNFLFPRATKGRMDGQVWDYKVIQLYPVGARTPHHRHAEIAGRGQHYRVGQTRRTGSTERLCPTDLPARRERV